MSNDKSLSPAGQVNTPVSQKSSTAEIAAFVKNARAFEPAASGRLILSLDATLSRQPTWDLACTLQAEMFDAVPKTANLQVQLLYFRGFGECRSSKFVTDTTRLKQLMSGIRCMAGQTQIGKVLSHALKESAAAKVSALIYIGDAMEESVDALADSAGRLGLKGVPVFVFQEGRDKDAEFAFKEIARLSRGAWFRFDRDSASTLAKLLSSIAVFATGGLAALEARNRPEDRLMIEHLSTR